MQVSPVNEVDEESLKDKEAAKLEVRAAVIAKQQSGENSARVEGPLQSCPSSVRVLLTGGWPSETCRGTGASARRQRAALEERGRRWAGSRTRVCRSRAW